MGFRFSKYMNANYVPILEYVLFNIFIIPVNECDAIFPPQLRKLDSNIGTIISSANYLMDINYEMCRHDMEKNKLGKYASNVNNLQNYFPNAALVGLQDDLVRVLAKHLPGQTISLTDMLGLLGYSTVFEFNEAERNNSMTYINSNNRIVSKTLYPLYGFGKTRNRRRTDCDIEVYLEHWLNYLKNSVQSSLSKAQRRNKGKCTLNISIHSLVHYLI